jgi:outer membrane protein OmpA-like peptidoglycan-associated protein
MTFVNRLILFLFAFLILESCSFGKKIKDGETAYERKQYSVAIDMLKNEYQKAENDRIRARTAYLLGMSYSYLEENSLSIEWLAKAVDKEYGNEALLKLAQAYKKGGEYNSAIDSYTLLKNSSNNKRQIDREIYVIKEVAKWADELVKGVKVQLMNENSGFSEYSPVILDKNFLVFTSDMTESTGGGDYKWTGNKHTDLFVMLKNGSEIKRFDAGINTNANEGTACFSKDGLEIVFTRCEDRNSSEGYCRLMYSERFSGVWSEPILIPIQNEGINYGQPTFIENDSVLVFSAKMEDGTGGHDLYYSERVYNEDGSFFWGEAFLFPPTINSQGNEMFPSGDGDTLYFSSDYFAGLGGLDIFKTWLQPNGEWAPPQNLKKPINSSFDDFGYVVDYNATLRGSEIQKGFFTSSRAGYGKEDIYKYERNRVVAPPSEDDPIEEQTVEIEIYLAGKTKEIRYNNNNDPNSGINGKANLEDCYITISDGQESENVYSDKSGQFYLQLKKGKDYSIKASKIGYLNSFETISTKDLKVEDGQLSTTLNVELVLNKIFTNVEITLENIYYNFNKSDIRSDAESTLDSLTQLLLQNPQIDVQLSSHTDCRGDDEYNLILSQKRAESAVAYMTRKGVSNSRMIAKGYGVTALAINCNCDDCTEEQHQINRRTTFKILE